MIKTKHIANFKGTLEDAIEQALRKNKVTRDNLIDIKYAVRVPAIIPAKGQFTKEHITVDSWYSSALIIWEES